MLDYSLYCYIQQIEAIVPESKLYTELLEFEKKLDATIMRKRLDLQETLNKPVKVLNLYHTVHSDICCTRQRSRNR